MFPFTTTNATYSINDNNELVKFNRHTGKQMKMDKVLPVKVQRAYDQWLESQEVQDQEVLADKVWTDAEKQALPYWFEDKSTDEDIIHDLEYLTEYFIQPEEYEAIDPGEIKVNKTTPEKFFVETNYHTYEAFSSDTHTVYITDTEISNRPFKTTMKDNLMENDLRQAYDEWCFTHLDKETQERLLKQGAKLAQEQSAQENNEIIIDQDLSFEGAEPVMVSLDGTNLKELRNERIQSESIKKIKDRMQVENQSFLSRVFKALAFPFFVFSTVILLATLTFALVQLVTSGRIPLANAIIGNTQELVTSSASNVVNINVNYGGQMLGENEI